MTISELFYFLGTTLIILAIIFVILATIYLMVVCMKEIKREMRGKKK